MIRPGRILYCPRCLPYRPTSEVIEGTNMSPKERIVAGEPDHTDLARLSRRLRRFVEKLAKWREAGDRQTRRRGQGS